VDVSAAAGVQPETPSYGPAWGDYDADGNLDLFVSNHGSDATLYRNLGKGCFAEVVDRVGIPRRGRDGHGPAWGDYDNDGDLDLIIVQGKRLGQVHRRLDQLYRNDGTLGFFEVAAQVGVGNPDGRARSPSWVDYDGDGDLDLFVVNFATPNVLYVNEGDGRFHLNTEAFAPPDETTWETAYLDGSAWADYDGDGRPDVFLAGYQGRLYRQVIPGRFQDVTRQALGSLPSYVRDAAWGDYDNDGDMDLYLVRGYEGMFDFVQAKQDFIWFGGTVRQDEDGIDFQATGVVSFDLIAQGGRHPQWVEIGEAGSHPEEIPFQVEENDPQARGTPPAFHRDGGRFALWQDHSEPTETWHLRWQAGAEHISFTGVIQTQSVTQVISVGFEPPPTLDLRNELYRNDGDGHFTLVSEEAGVADGGNGRVGSWADFDNDGWLDLFVVNSGDVASGNGLDRLYHNQHDGTFRDVTILAGVAGPTMGRGSGAAWGDYDNDGFLDLFVTNGLGPPPFSAGPHKLYRNSGNGNHWLEIDLQGRRSQRQGNGTTVVVVAGPLRQLRQQLGGGHALAQDSITLHFGLGTATEVDQISVSWPSGTRQVLRHVPADQKLVIIEPE